MFICKSKALIQGILMAVMLSFAAFVHSQPNQDESTLLKIHKNILQALLNNDIDRLFLDVSERIFIVENGLIKWKEKDLAIEERRALMKKFNFSVYEDVEQPLVKVSSDGSLGWLVVRVRIEGRETSIDGLDIPVSMFAAWIELYEKINGTWRFVGSVASTSENP